MHRWLLLVPIFCLLFGVGWKLSDRLERRNDFCNSCHLPDGTALHLEIRERFDRVVPMNLAGVHGRGWVEEREDSDFRCIDCHAGSGPIERGVVKLLAARDGLRYVAGSFEEPKGMAFALSRDTCQRCHPGFRHSAAPGWTLESYHGRPGHEGDDNPRCVRCHAVHEAGGDPFAYFMSRARVDAACLECHLPDGDLAIPSLVRHPRQSR